MKTSSKPQVCPWDLNGSEGISDLGEPLPTASCSASIKSLKPSAIPGPLRGPESVVAQVSFCYHSAVRYDSPQSSRITVLASVAGSLSAFIGMAIVSNNIKQWAQQRIK